MTEPNVTDDPDYWARNVRARVEQNENYDVDEFEISVPEDAYASVVLELTRTDDADEWTEDEWTRFLSVLQRGGFETTTNGTRPVEGVHVLEREPLEYPYAEADL